MVVVEQFRRDIDFFKTFFRQNEQFVPEGARFSISMADSLDSLKSIDNVNQAKENFFRGNIVLHVMKRYLEAVMMFELWNSYLSCQKDHQDDCSRLKAIVRNNPLLFANQGSTKEGLFKAESDCLVAPKSGSCSADWNRARGILNDRMRMMHSRFEDIIRPKLRQYFQERPAVSPMELNATKYDRSEIVAVLTTLQKNILLEVSQRNQMLMNEISQVMSAEMVIKLKTQMSHDAERLTQLEAELKRSITDAQRKLYGEETKYTDADVRRVLREDQTWNESLGLTDEDGAKVDMLRVEQIEAQLKQTFGIMDGLVTLLEEHQARTADMFDQTIADLKQRISSVEQTSDFSKSTVDERLAALERQFHAQQDNVIELKEQVRKLSEWKSKMMMILSSIMFLSVLAVLCEALTVPVRPFSPT